MVDRAETVTSDKTTIVTAATTKRYEAFEAQVSTSDTITMADFTTVNGAALFKKSDGTAVTVTVATNVITVTQAALTNVDCIGIAVGT